ncbi:MAG: efflux RND transporter periplasmic adaptor subunit [Planctomycetaceae bacterium]|jgi:membrane fusion protein (multidrug efflux system)|nr:efflux RND transporter periplasmic adaptor subunit [Planctomycetaceae bacterium]
MNYDKKVFGQIENLHDSNGVILANRYRGWDSVVLVLFGRLGVVVGCVLCLLMLCCSVGCNKAAQGNAAGKAPEPPEVIVDKVAEEDVQLYVYASGETTPYKSVDIRVRVPGYLMKYFCSHGEIVNQGSKIALIEQEQYKYELNSRKQDLIIAEQRATQAKTDYERDIPLGQQGVKTPEEILQRKTEYNTAVANVERCKVAIQQAELNLQYTEITAPITGKTSQHLVDENNFISPGTAESKILSIRQFDPIYVDFTLSDTDFTDLKERMGYRDAFDKLELKSTPANDNKINNTKNNKTANSESNDNNAEYLGYAGGSFEMTLTSSSDAIPSSFLPTKGTIKGAISNQIQTRTGQVTIRGEMRNPLINVNNNPDYLIYPGQICRVRIPYDTIKDAILINEEALQTDLDTKYVFVVRKGMYTPPLPPGTKETDNTAARSYETDLAFRQDVKIGRLLENQRRIILSGLKPGDRYVVKGVQRARHGSPVTPVEISDFNERRAAIEANPNAAIPAPAQKDNKQKTSENNPENKTNNDTPKNE